MKLAEQVKQAGVVGAGGAGFPTHVKLGAQVEWYLVNGAECEPLMHKDRELLTHFAMEVVVGLELAAEAVGASKLAIGVKSKNQSAIAALQKAVGSKNISLHEFGDYYPVGDEYELVYGITGRLIPPQGLPLHVGVIVSNPESLYNVYQAHQGQPVTDTFLTITGAVKNPLTMWVPVGMLIRDVLDLAGGASIASFRVMESGLMMGKLVADLDQPVTKTTGGLIVLPTRHQLIQRYLLPQKAMDRIGHSACDQCSYCTELCPRYLLGYNVQPHLVMRSLGFTAVGSGLWNQHAQLCCQCGICTLYSCPEALYPREACVGGINELRAAGKDKWEGSTDIKVHPMKDSRRVPLPQLMTRLGVSQYDSHAEFVAKTVDPPRVAIPLKQHTGIPAEPIVQIGHKVHKGQLIAQVPTDKLGANIHASISGTVIGITQELMIVER